MLKCLPSKAAHCSSLKSFFCLEQGSELQERNFIRRPTQYFPPFLGLTRKSSSHKETPRLSEIFACPCQFVQLLCLQEQSAHGKRTSNKYAKPIYSLGKEKTLKVRSATVSGHAGLSYGTLTLAARMET